MAVTRPFYHTVLAGETLRSVAARYGISATMIWDHPNNARLRRERDPHILATGDRIWIPAPTLPLVEYTGTPVLCRTGRSYIFGHAQLVPIRVHFEERDGSVMARWNYRLHLRGRAPEGQLTADGVLSVRVPLSTALVMIEIWPPDSPPRTSLRFELAVAHLDPASERRGVQQRLSNLGFYAGALEGQESKALEAAMIRFRAFQGMSDDADEQQLLDALRHKHRT